MSTRDETVVECMGDEGLGLHLEGEAAAIMSDRKVLRGTRSDQARTMQILAAGDQQTGCVLSEAQISADTNEAKTALANLESLVLQVRTVAGDAAFYQRDICITTIAADGNYLFTVKDAQPTLQKEAVQAFVIPEGRLADGA